MGDARADLSRAKPMHSTRSGILRTTSQDNDHDASEEGFSRHPWCRVSRLSLLSKDQAGPVDQSEQFEQPYHANSSENMEQATPATQVGPDGSSQLKSSLGAARRSLGTLARRVSLSVSGRQDESGDQCFHEAQTLKENPVSSPEVSSEGARQVSVIAPARRVHDTRSANDLRESRRTEECSVRARAFGRSQNPGDGFPPRNVRLRRAEGHADGNAFLGQPGGLPHQVGTASSVRNSTAYETQHSDEPTLTFSVPSDRSGSSSDWREDAGLAGIHAQPGRWELDSARLFPGYHNHYSVSSRSGPAKGSSHGRPMERQQSSRYPVYI